MAHSWSRRYRGASFLADVGHEVPTALLPSLLVSTVGAPAAALGLIEGFSEALAGAARFGGGALADDPQRRRRVAVGGYTATAVLSSATGFATNAWQVGLLRAERGPLAGCVSRRVTRCLPTAFTRVPTAARTGSSAPWTTWGRSSGRCSLSASSQHSASARPSPCRSSRDCWQQPRSCTPSVVPRRQSSATVSPSGSASVRCCGRPRPSHGRRLPAFEVGNVAATLLILRATELLTPRHGLGTATSLALGLYVAYNVAAALVSFPAGRFADRFGPRGPNRVLVAGVLLFAFAYAAFAVGSTSLVVLGLPFLAAGAGIGCVETAEHAAVAAASPAELRGSAFGLLAGVQSLGNLGASAVAGLLWTTVSPAVAFWYVTGWMVLAVTTLVVAKR
ncbi:MAG: MFS transporter [Nocardioidaceae bacterium]